MEDNISTGGYRYEFVKEVNQLFKCSICKYVARDPQVTRCCGECFCKACTELVLQTKEQAMCKKEHCEHTPASYISQPKYNEMIRLLEIKCPQAARGCEWTGSIKDLEEAHVNETTGDCSYIDIDCPNSCKEKVQKNCMDTHLKDRCLKREYQCRHCSKKSTFEDIVEVHQPQCAYSAQVCPNLCGVSCERAEMPLHLNICRLQVVKCSFQATGCDAEFTREKEETHMKQTNQPHLEQMVAAFTQLKQHFTKSMEDKDKQLIEIQRRLAEGLQMRDQQVRAMEANLRQEHQAMEHKLNTRIWELEMSNGNLPYHFEVQDYSKYRSHGIIFYSPFMLTHPAGYRVRISIRPNGYNSVSTTGKYISVWLRSAKGYFDAQLQWPAKVTVTLQLCNQYRDDGHVTITQSLQWQRISKDKTFTFSNCVDPISVRLIAIKDLGWNSEKQTQFLHGDCLRFKVLSFLVQ